MEVSNNIVNDFSNNSLWEKQLHIKPEEAKKFIYGKKSKGFTAIKEWFSVTANRIVHLIFRWQWLNKKEILSFVKTNFDDLKQKTFTVLTTSKDFNNKKDFDQITRLYQKVRPLFKVFVGTEIEDDVWNWTNYGKLEQTYERFKNMQDKKPVIIDDETINTTIPAEHSKEDEKKQSDLKQDQHGVEKNASDLPNQPSPASLPIEEEVKQIPTDEQKLEPSAPTNGSTSIESTPSNKDVILEKQQKDEPVKKQDDPGLTAEVISSHQAVQIEADKVETILKQPNVSQIDSAVNTVTLTGGQSEAVVVKETVQTTDLPPPIQKIDLQKYYVDVLKLYEDTISNQTWKTPADRAKELDHLKNDMVTGVIFSGIPAPIEYNHKKAFVLKTLTDSLADQSQGELIVKGITDLVEYLMQPDVKKEDRQKVKRFIQLILCPVDNKSGIEEGVRLYIITKFINNLIHLTFYMLDDYTNMHNELALVKKCETASSSWAIVNFAKSAAQYAADKYITWRKGLIVADLAHIPVLQGKEQQITQMIDILFPFFTTLMWADRDKPPVVKAKAKTALTEFHKQYYKQFMAFDSVNLPTKQQLSESFAAMCKDLTQHLKPQLSK